MWQVMLQTNQKLKMIRKTIVGLSSNKNLHCPKCMRKVAKLLDMTGNGKFISVRHKGMEVLARDAVIKCVGCKTSFLVTTDNGIEKEVNLG